MYSYIANLHSILIIALNEFVVSFLVCSMYLREEKNEEMNEK